MLRLLTVKTSCLKNELNVFDHKELSEIIPVDYVDFGEIQDLTIIERVEISQMPATTSSRSFSNKRCTESHNATKKKIGSNPHNVPYLDGALREVELGGQLAPPRPGHVVLLVELLLEPGQLVPGEGSPVPPDVGVARIAAAGAAATAATVDFGIGDRARAVCGRGCRLVL